MRGTSKELNNVHAAAWHGGDCLGVRPACVQIGVYNGKANRGLFNPYATNG